jgi:hypothetical protein
MHHWRRTIPARPQFCLREQLSRPASVLRRTDATRQWLSGRALPSGRTGDHRHQAPSCFVLAGRAPDVPYASVRSGHPRTTTVDAHARRAVGSVRTEWSEVPSQARGGLVAPVRAGSAQHQEPMVLGGHERAVSANKNRRSQGIHRSHLGRHNSLVPGSSPSSGTQEAVLKDQLTKPGPWRRP